MMHAGRPRAAAVDRTGRPRAGGGVCLLLVAAMVVLMMLSVLLMARFGSDTRHLLHRCEMAARCDLAATSALVEARALAETELTASVEAWDAEAWWKGLLPPFTGDLPAPRPALAVPATGEAFAPRGITVGDVEITCLDRQAARGRAQGLLSLRVSVSCSARRDAGLTLTREEHVRYVVWRHPAGGLRLLLVPGHVGVEVSQT